MLTSRITQYRPLPRPVPAIEWTVELTYGANSADGLLLSDWIGSVELFKRSITGQDPAGGADARLELRAEWRGQASGHRRSISGGSSIDHVFLTELPGLALDHVEAFREGALLHAQLGGEFTGLPLGNERHTPHGAPQRLKLEQSLAGTGNMNTARVTSRGSLELGRWPTEVLSTLRPEDRLLVEIVLPAAEFEDPIVGTMLKQARRDFDDGGYPEVSRKLFVVIERLMTHSSQLDGPYGEAMARLIKGMLKGVRGVTNGERHGREPDPLEKTDRRLAQAALAAVQGLCAVYLRD